MNARIFGLVALLLASTASEALAQERGAFGRGHVAAPSPSPAAPQAQVAPAAPAAPQSQSQGISPRGDGGRSGWSRGRSSDTRVGPQGPARDVGPTDTRRHRWSRAEDTVNPADADRRRQEQWREDRRGDGRRNRDDRWEDRRADDRGRDRDRRPEWNGDRRRDHGDRGQRWARNRYPPIYNSPSRYHGPAWYPPTGYYARNWRYGEILPSGWYGPDYQILEWWDYDLPEPPYGYQWVRTGRDVVLVDLYTGRIVQVVRLVFR